MNFPTWSISVDLRSHKSQLVIVALSASAVTAGFFAAYHNYNKRQKRIELQRDVLRAVTKSSPGPLQAALPPIPDDIWLNGSTYVDNTDLGYDEKLIREQLARNYAFFGEESMAKIRRVTVVVVGCGGVGSWAAVMLVKSGLSKIRFVDFDYVTLSSLNRHATAGLADVGTPKVKCVEKALHEFSKCVETGAREKGRRRVAA